MAIETLSLATKAHELIGQLDHGKLAAVVHVMEAMLDQDDDEEEVFSPEDVAKIQASREYFRQGGQGISFEQAVAECGFTMEQITGSTQPRS